MLGYYQQTRDKRNIFDMNRRLFLAALAGFSLDPERALWKPGAKLISIPAPVVVAPVHVVDEINWITLYISRQIDDVFFKMQSITYDEMTLNGQGLYSSSGIPTSLNPSSL